MLVAEAERIDHAPHVNVHRFGGHLELRAVDRNRLGTLHPRPNGDITLHFLEQGTDHLDQHGGEVRAGVLGIVDLGAEKRLADAEATANGLGAHPDIDPEAGDIAVPDLLFQIVVEHGAREPELAADGLADALAVQRAGQGKHDAVRDGAVVLVALVEGRGEVEPLVENRAEQQVDPFGGDAAQVRVHDGTGPRAELLGHQKDRAQGAAFAGNAVVGGRQLVDRRDRVGYLHERRFIVRGFEHLLRGAVLRAAVGVDDDTAQTGEVLPEPGVNGADDVLDGRGVVVAGYPDDDVGATDIRNTGPRRRRQQLFFSGCYSRRRALSVLHRSAS